jgi:hypothetical protein
VSRLARPPRSRGRRGANPSCVTTKPPGREPPRPNRRTSDRRTEGLIVLRLIPGNEPDHLMAAGRGAERRVDASPTALNWLAPAVKEPPSPHARDCHRCGPRSHTPTGFMGGQLPDEVALTARTKQVRPAPQRPANAHALGQPKESQVLCVNTHRVRRPRTVATTLHPFHRVAKTDTRKAPRSPRAEALGERGDDAKTDSGMVAEPQGCGQSKVRHCAVRTSKQTRPPILMRGCTVEQPTPASAKPSVVDALLLTLRPISIADAVAKRHGRTK